MHNFIASIILLCGLFLESFSAFLFKDSKKIEERINETDNLELLLLLKGEAREYTGFSLGACLSSLWLTVGLFIATLIIFNGFLLLLTVSSMFLNGYFFNHWRYSNYLGDKCLNKISSL